MTCYKSGGCGVYENRSCSECPASKPEYANKLNEAKWVYDHWCEFKCSNCGNFSNSKPHKGMEKYCPECGSKMVNFKR